MAEVGADYCSALADVGGTMAEAGADYCSVLADVGFALLHV